MFKRVLPILLLLAVFLTACGAQTTPTMSSVDTQNTAVAAAWTMVAATQIANPTETPLPPTETPSPTSTQDTLFPSTQPTTDLSGIPTLPSLPTLPSFPTALPTSPPSVGDCMGLLNVKAAGSTNRMRIENTTGGVINLSLHLDKNLFGECGFMPGIGTIKKGAQRIVALPRGDWFAYALVDYGGNKSGNASGYFTVRLGDHDLLRIIVKQEVVKVQP